MIKSYILIILFFITLESSACGCRNNSLERQVELADLIIFGQLISAQYSDNKRLSFAITGKFKILNGYKGNDKVGNNLELETASNSGMCGIPMVIGEYYVIFKQNEDKQIGSCGGSRIIGDDGFHKAEYMEKLLPLLNSFTNKYN